MKTTPFIITFTVLGSIIGVVSSYITNSLIVFALLIGSYLALFIPIYLKKKNEKEIKKLILETTLNYLLVWIVFFFLFSNL